MSLIERIYRNSPIFAQDAMVSLQGWRLKRDRTGGPLFKGLVDQHARFELMTRSDIDAYQLGKLADFIQHAKATSPYYSRAIPKNLKIESLDDVRRLPVLEKNTLRKETDAIKSNAVVGPLVEAHTSGTTGTPITVKFTQDDFRFRMSAWERMWNWYGVNQNSRKIRFSGRTLFPKAESNNVFWRMNYPGRQMFMSSYHMAPANLDVYLDRIAEYAPEIIDGYPSSIYLIARHALLHGKWKIRPKLVMTTAETLEDFQRDAIAEAFRCPVKTQYGSSEGAPLACEDEDGEIAIFPQSGLIEIVKPGTDELVKPGDVGEMLVTCFNTHAYPLIRYRIGDSAAIASHTKRRPGFQRLTRLTGRQEDYIISPERGPVGRLDPVFKKSPPSIIECQIVQIAANVLELHYVPDIVTFRMEHLTVVADEINARCGNMELRYVKHDHMLPRSANGKLRAVIRKM
jgi:phenylacetate-CoA ligase